MAERGRRLAMMIVAALLLAACGGGGDEATDPQAEQTQSPAGEGQTEAPEADIVVIGTNSLDFVPSEMEAEAGTISVALISEGDNHTFTVELDEGAKTVAQVFAGEESDIGEIELEAGTYTVFCAIPLHREGGMEGTLTVS